MRGYGPTIRPALIERLELSRIGICRLRLRHTSRRRFVRRDEGTVRALNKVPLVDRVVVPSRLLIPSLVLSDFRIRGIGDDYPHKHVEFVLFNDGLRWR